MVSAYYRATVSVPTDSGLPQDSMNNVWSFRHALTADHTADATEIVTRLTGFYADIDQLFSSQLDFTQTRITIVDLAEDRPRIPFYDETHVWFASVTSEHDLPAEVAVCLSFRAPIISGQNARRRRGRVYLGPLQAATGDQFLVDNTWPGAIVAAATSNVGVEDGDVFWCVYSPYTHHDVPVGEKLDPEIYPEVPGELTNAFTPISHVWVDNAWDTQRRRGITATLRATADL